MIKKTSKKSLTGFIVAGLAGVFSLALAVPAFAQDINPPEDQSEPPKKEYSPFVGDHFPTQPTWLRILKVFLRERE